jgi:hypothetical protein
MRIIGMVGCKFNMGAERTPVHVSSIKPEKILKAVKSTSGADLINYHKFHFTRVYPAATKIDSSNYNPVDSWVFGA